jgi:hypothetical protein
MANRNLTSAELTQANTSLANIRQRLSELAAGDPATLFTFRRKIAKELTYDERGKPAERNKLKARKFGEQRGICTECGQRLPERFAELDRKNAMDGYTPENTELIHGECHRKSRLREGGLRDEPIDTDTIRFLQSTHQNPLGRACPGHPRLHSR